jgi:hypothetical protein
MLIRLRTFGIGLASVVGVAGCAAIWGFDDGTLGAADGGPDATLDAHPSYDSGRDVTLHRDAGQDGMGHSHHDAAHDVRREVDAEHDAAHDAREDVAHDAREDVAHDARHDVARDAAHDTASDVRHRHDAPEDARHDTGHDAGHGQDAARDTGAFDAPPPCTAVCQAAAPAGWSGPFRIFEGSPGTAPACPAPLVQVYEGLAQPKVPDAGCACSCGPADGGTCGAALSEFTSASCGAPALPGDDELSVPLGACVPIPTIPGGNIGRAVGPLTPVPGACAPSPPTEVPDASWEASVLACGAPDAAAVGTCDAGQVCLPQADAGQLESTYCVMQAGAGLACPSPYTVPRSQFFAGGTDTRVCGACACGPASTSCGGTASVLLYHSGGNAEAGTCTGTPDNPHTLSVPDTCSSGPGDGNRAMLSGVLVGQGTCAPDGGQLTGAFTTDQPTTICCTP